MIERKIKSIEINIEDTDDYSIRELENTINNLNFSFTYNFKGEEEIREEYESFKDSLNPYDISYFEKRYIEDKESFGDYKEFDIWLFEWWEGER